jgi:hypothetical protein
VKNRRFEHLEGPRAKPATDATPVKPVDARFDPDQATKPTVSAAKPSDRFNGAAPEVQVDSTPLGRLPTLLCAACQTESSKFETTCSGCGARLDTPATVALNTQRLEQRDAEATAELQAAQRARGEALAQEVRKQFGPAPQTTTLPLGLWGVGVAFVIAATLGPWPAPFKALVWLMVMARVAWHLLR